MRLFLSILLCLATPLLADDLQARIDAAEPGATINVGPGVYGPIKTDKPIHLIGTGSPVIDGGGKSDCVIMVGGDSTIRGFTIRNSGSDLDRESCGLRVMGPRTVIDNNVFTNVLFGIDLKKASDCIIQNNVIGAMSLEEARRGDALRLFRSDRCLIEANTIEDGRDSLLWYSNQCVVRKNVSRRNRYGFHLMYANDVVLEDNDISHNSVGIYLMYGKGFTVRNNRITHNRGPSGYGVGFKEVDKYQISHNILSGNCVAIYLDGSPLRRKPGDAFITNNAIVCNDIGFSFLPSVRGNTIRGNNLIDNIEQLAVQGRGNVRENIVEGNHWSDYVGYDLDRDGVGDQRYESRKLFESLTTREPKLRLMIYSPAHDAIEFIGRAIPAVAPETRFSDPAPLLRPANLDFDTLDPPQSTPVIWAAVCLFTIGTAIGVFTFTPRRTIGRTTGGTR
jgi:nitrous oxidase accessory protein